MMQFITKNLQALKWPIQSKIGLAFAVILLGFVINGIISLILLININNTGNREYLISQDSARVATYLLAYQNEVNIYSDAIFITKSNFVRDDYKDLIVNTLQDTSAGDKAFETNFSQLYLQIYDYFTDLQSYIQIGDFQTATQTWHQHEANFNTMSNLLTAEQQQLKTQLYNAENDISQTVFISTVIIVAVTIGSIILAILTLLIVRGVLVQPLNEIKQGLRRIATGQLNSRLNVHNQDEIGELAKTFQVAVNALQNVISGVQVTTDLQTVTQELTQVSEKQQLGSTEQVSALTQIAAGMQELGHTAGLIAGSAIEVAGLIGKTLDQIVEVNEAEHDSRQQAYQMVQVVETTLESIEQIGTQVNVFRELMDDLNNQSEAISRVVELLNSISKEVHLLSINAAIEAAGAGEYGTRFKMVARAVKQLADRAHTATEEAHLLISQVQNSNRNALEQVEIGQNQVTSVIEANSSLRQNLQHLTESTSRVGLAVNTLLALAERVRTQAEEIKQATQQQRVSNDQILSSTHLVENIAEESAVTAVQIANSSKQLEGLAEQLSEVLSQVSFVA